jgi:hypothetical protein
MPFSVQQIPVRSIHPAWLSVQTVDPRRNRES